MNPRQSGWTTALTAVLLAGAMFALSGCSWFEGDAPEPGAAPAAPDAVIQAPPDEDEFDAEEPKPDKPPPKSDLRNDIVSLVNDEPITVYTLEQRAGLILMLTGARDTPENRAKAREQAIDSLETEILRRLEAQKYDISVSTPDVDKNIQDIVESSHTTMDQLKQLLVEYHTSMSALRWQVANQMLWRRAVQMMFGGRVNISPETVDAEMARIMASADKTHYKVLEIFIAVDNPDQDEKAHKDILGLYNQVKAGAPFGAVARQFSQSPSAGDNGSIGEVYDGQLAPELNAALAKMKTGDISEPIRSTGGYYVLALAQRYEPAGTKIEETKPEDRALPPTLPLVRLLLPLGPNPPKTLVENAMDVGNKLAAQVPNCRVLGEISKNIQHSVFMNLGETKLADMSPQIRAILAATEPGRVAKPFLSEAGLEIIGRCDKPVIKLQAYTPPTREEVEQMMFEDQITAMARRYDRDLRRSATIERRVPGKKAELAKAPERKQEVRPDTEPQAAGVPPSDTKPQAAGVPPSDTKPQAAGVPPSAGKP